MNLIAYTDGSARPNDKINGITGYGIHIYLTDGKKTKILENNFVATNKKYISKSDMNANHIEAPINTIVDIYGSDNDSKTNNQAELDAVINLLYEIEINEDRLYQNVDNIYIHIDSQYVLNVLKRIDDKSDHILDKNVPHIKKLKALYLPLKDKFTIIASYVEAHNNDLGNEKADLLSNMGRILYDPQKNIYKRVETDASIYYGKYTIRPPYLNNKWLFVLSNKQNAYYLVQYKDDIDIGKRLNKATYTIVDTHKEIDTDLHIILNLINKINGKTTKPFVLNLDALYNKFISKKISIYQEDYLKVDTKLFNKVLTVDDALLGNEIYPAGVSYLAEDILEKLTTIYLDSFKEDITYLKKLDITDRYLENHTLKKEILNDKYTDKISLSPLDIKHHIRLDLNLDLPKRNTLKKLEKHIEKIELILLIEDRVVKAFTLVTLLIEDKRDYIFTSNYYASTTLRKGVKK